MKNLFKNAIKSISNENIRHILLNWSETEIGKRHPSGPIGFVLRDQGIVDIYSGKTRFLLDITGNTVSICTNFTSVSTTTNFKTVDIESFKINGKSFDSDLFLGQSIAAIGDISSYSVIGPQTRVVVNGAIGELIDTVPMSKFMTPKQIFSTPQYESLEIDIVNKIREII